MALHTVCIGLRKMAPARARRSVCPVPARGSDAGTRNLSRGYFLDPIHDLVNMWQGHDPKAALCAINPIFIGYCKLLCLLEECLHVPPPPTWVGKILPLIEVLTVATEVHHPVEHAAEPNFEVSWLQSRMSGILMAGQWKSNLIPASSQPKSSTLIPYHPCKNKRAMAL